MAYTTQQLITASWYLSGIISRGLETVEDEQLNDGLERLNGLLAASTSNTGLIPYYKQYTFPAVPNQEIYYIEYLVDAETLTFNIGPIRYNMLYVGRQDYFGSSRVDNISSLPYQWHLERLNDGSNIYMYFLPQQAYEMKLWGKFQLNNVDFNQDLTVIYQDFYIEYMRYKLAEFLCEYYNVAFPVLRTRTLASYEQAIRNVSPIDLTMQKLSMFQPGSPFNYADVSLGRGWRPSS